MSLASTYGVSSACAWKTTCASRRTARNCSLRRVHRWKIPLELCDRKMMQRIAIALLVAWATTHGFAVEAPSPPSYRVRMENAWIPMKDGVRLSATLYMPDGAKPGEKFPAILEYQPY